MYTSESSFAQYMFLRFIYVDVYSFQLFSLLYDVIVLFYHFFF